jgi:hypothetical protein
MNGKIAHADFVEFRQRVVTLMNELHPEVLCVCLRDDLLLLHPHKLFSLWLQSVGSDRVRVFGIWYSVYPSLEELIVGRGRGGRRVRSIGSNSVESLKADFARQARIRFGAETAALIGLL